MQWLSILVIRFWWLFNDENNSVLTQIESEYCWSEKAASWKHFDLVYKFCVSPYIWHALVILKEASLLYVMTNYRKESFLSKLTELSNSKLFIEIRKPYRKIIPLGCCVYTELDEILSGIEILISWLQFLTPSWNHDTIHSVKPAWSNFGSWICFWERGEFFMKS